jgi:P4 family phage/plasmid primase-like protien
MSELMLTAAIQFERSGLSVVRADPSTKRPMSKWKEYQEKRAPASVLRGWFSANNTGIGIIPGSVSGNLEVLDHDCKELWDAYCQLVTMEDPDLMAKLPIVQTQRANHHIFYRCETIEGNLKLARRMNGKGWDTLIETRGEGGFVVTAPSPGYRMLQGKLTQIPIITPEERRTLLNAGRAFDEMGVEENEVRPAGIAQNGNRPGDDFNQRGDGLGVLLSNGWLVAHQATIEGRQVSYLRRPGKRDGWSATYNYIDNRLFVFSSNAGPFEAERVYGPFAILAMLDHAGDFGAAAKALAIQGYGQQVTATEETEAETPATAIAAKFHRCTDMGNGERLVAQEGEGLRFSYAMNKWFVWTGKQWLDDDLGIVEKKAKDTARGIQQEATRIEDETIAKAVEKWGRSSEGRAKVQSMIFMARSDLAITPAELDSDPWLLNVNNGTIDLRTGTLRPHNPEDLITKMAPVDYDPNARAPLWLSFLDRIMSGNQDVIKFLQRITGYSLTGSTREQCIFILHGIGANGKSTYLETIADVLGDYANTTPTQTLMPRRADAMSNDLARLAGSRFVTATETDDGHKLAESLVKQMTGGEQVAARFLYGEIFQFRPKFKIFLGTNHQPEIVGTDHGIWRRIKKIKFDVVIPDEEQDKNLKQKLLQEAPGILAWAVRGCQEWLAAGLQEPEEVTEATRRYRADMDVLADFLTDCCDVGAINATVSISELYRAYSKWCEESGERALSKLKFGRRMAERGFRQDRTGQERYWHGISLLDSPNQLMMDGV